MRRGARIYAEIIGYGCSADAHHITASHPDGLGAVEAMRAALADAKIQDLSQIGYINAHATSTPMGDLAEAKAIGHLLRGTGRRGKVLVGANKGAIGHLLGAAGAVEAIYTLLALHRSVIPPTLNFHGMDRDTLENAEIVKDVCRDLPRASVALKNSFGFGGTNASLCFTSAQ